MEFIVTGTIRGAVRNSCWLNAVATYVYWGLLEPEPGRWDFTGENDIAAFIREARSAGLWVLLRTGPYAYAEWDFGGLPPWLLRLPDIKVRCRDPQYLAACESYIQRLSAEVRHLQVQRGGPIVYINVDDARARGIRDGANVRVYNDIDEFEIMAKVSPSVRPGQVIIYHAWENFQFKNGKGFRT